MQYSVSNVWSVALWGAFAIHAVTAQNGKDLLPGDKDVWQGMKGVDAWRLPSDTVKTGGKDGSVTLKGSKDRVRCGVVPYDKDGNVWMIPANGNFDQVGYILPRGGYDSRHDTTLADCVVREAKEEGGLVIDVKSLVPLGRSNHGSVYWYKGSVTKHVKPTEPRPQPPKAFKLNDARKEMQKPASNPKKKADMRMALHTSVSADDSKNYRSTFKPLERGGPSRPAGGQGSRQTKPTR
ncbi:hypothetical protein COL26b_013272 [Colletotrichum chrysophilum]|uniref:uncharacterized protein n=1 Tax=Colletotrichum chrysophilum TaxID=1836956 RepID=UPI0022FFD6EF|nr:uncharacterized protein COL26b_013272 [Colletotrichum chrysophilum]KAJ0302670.1 hypothetical protein Brms1b_011975 [Colletotrichum noveboracense]KAJ0362590.1 hypothetical protein COL26b_013272 [Colletotrichum chrysophilum]